MVFSCMTEWKEQSNILVRHRVFSLYTTAYVPQYHNTTAIMQAPNKQRNEIIHIKERE